MKTLREIVSLLQSDEGKRLLRDSLVEAQSNPDKVIGDLCESCVTDELDLVGNDEYVAGVQSYYTEPSCEALSSDLGYQCFQAANICIYRIAA